MVRPPTVNGNANQGILIVEDEAIIVMLLKHILTRAGYDIPGVANAGERGIALTNELHPSLVIMGISLKGDMDGIEAARTIMDNHQIPVIFISSPTDKATFDRAMSTGPAHYIVKPIKDTEVLAAIQSALKTNQDSHPPRVI